jgi:7,8-dihydropterin-6-yl-methyl-4-(beta-D-ribofuranosyl)aminobenzene 5'-phosphate synthase
MTSLASLKITILVEDSAPKEPFLGEHGLSLLIETDGKKILFDSGYSGDALLYNAKILNLDLNTINSFVLSHPHDDHSGGMGKISPLIATKPMFCTSDAFGIYMPQSEVLKSRYSNVHLVTENTEIIPGLWVIKERPTINTFHKTNEINIVAHLEGKGLVVIIGCAHHGLSTIIADAKKALNNKIPIYALVGGFHLKNSSPEEVASVIDLFRKEQIQLLLPNHCTGFGAVKQLVDAMPQQTAFISKTASGTFHTCKTFEF